MLLNLSGAHGPYFTRNILILKDSAGHVGVGEVPGGEAIRQTLEDARALLLGQPVGNYNALLNQARRAFADRDVGAAACRPSICASPSTRSPRWSRRCSICSASTSVCRWPPCSAKITDCP